MTLNEVKNLLTEQNISFSEQCYPSVGEYYRHLSPFANLKNAPEYRVMVLVILSRNGHKDIELQFVERGDGYEFEDLYFGAYSYELFGCLEADLPQFLVEEIADIMADDVVVITVNDLKKKKWRGDAVYSKKENDAFGLPGLKRAMTRIHGKKSLLSDILGSKIQCEIYDWNTYQCVIK